MADAGEIGVATEAAIAGMAAGAPLVETAMVAVSPSRVDAAVDATVIATLTALRARPAGMANRAIKSSIARTTDPTRGLICKSPVAATGKAVKRKLSDGEV